MSSTRQSAEASNQVTAGSSIVPATRPNNSIEDAFIASMADAFTAKPAHPIGHKAVEYSPEYLLEIFEPPTRPAAPPKSKWACPGQQEPWMTPLPIPPHGSLRPRVQNWRPDVCWHGKEMCAECHEAQPIPPF